MKRKMERIALILISPILYLIFWFINAWRPSISVESSDGKWGDHESPFKGRYLDEIVYYFEKYKLRCNAPAVTMIRTTPKNLFNVFAWPSYLLNKKWKLEYREPLIGPQDGYYTKIWDCYNKPSGITNEEYRLNQARDEFFKNLANIKQPSLFSMP